MQRLTHATHATGSGPTLAVVARMAGVSVPTASKVVNGREDVAPETRRRVAEALDRLGYIRRHRPVNREVTLVDVVVHALDSTWSGAVLRGAEEAAHEAGLEVVVSAGLTRSRRGRPERGLLDRLAGRGSAGALLNLAELTPSHHAWFAEHRIPLVLIDPACEPPPGVPAVGAANRRGGESATAHLLELGHRRVAVIGGYRRKLCSAARVAGYRDAMRDAGCPRPPQYQVYGAFSVAGGYRCMNTLLDLPERPTAVFVCSDPMALGAYRALTERGLRVPDDISVVGFDDLPEAGWPDPPLTTVRQPLAEMGRTGMRLLADVLAGGKPPARPVELPTQLMIRGSTAPPSDAGG